MNDPYHTDSRPQHGLERLRLSSKGHLKVRAQAKLRDERRMKCLRALLLMLLALSSVSLAQGPGKPLTPEELSRFLGPVPPEAFTWTKRDGIDYVVFYGHANPPLAGDVGIYCGGYPSFRPPPGSKIVTGKLGIFPVEWHRATSSEGVVRQEALVQVTEYGKRHILVTAKQQSDIERIIELVARLPDFTSKPEPDR